MAGRRGGPPPHVGITEEARRLLPDVFAAAPALDDVGDVLTVSMPVQITVSGETNENRPTPRMAIAHLRGRPLEEFLNQVESGRYADAVNTAFSQYWGQGGPYGVDIHEVREITWQSG